MPHPMLSQAHSQPPARAKTASGEALHCVIGSGPAGVACASALLARGAKVKLLDAGVWLEPSRAEFVAQMRRTPPDAWQPGLVARLKEGTSANTRGIPLKLVYGSDFPYRECDQHVPADYHGVALRASLARGGFTNVWGAAMMPYAGHDMAGWPIQVSDLAGHYAAVLKITGLSAARDNLEPLFPLYQDRVSALDLSRQSAALLKRLERNQSRLAGAGIHFGRARVAVQVAQPAQPAGCCHCGLCMYGCPYGYIYNSESTLRQLQTLPGFTYESDVIVTNVRESSVKVFIEGYHRVTRAPVVTEASRAYIAAGSISTSQILLRSSSLYDKTVWMKDSQYFLLPLAMLAGSGDVRHESLHTLSQLFLEIMDPGVSPHTVHLQLYSYNDLIGQAVAGALGSLAAPFGFLARALETRLLIVQGYLHSEHSPRIALALRKGGPGRADRLDLAAEPNAETKPMLRRVIRKLLRHARHLGGVPLQPMLQIAEAGRGFHSGGTFPMRSRPAALESDTLGRPFGWQRVHAVDASVLPAIPATTITFSVMANAHRIGWLAANMA